eukprot:1334268-Amphidinium_carterae.1
MFGQSRHLLVRHRTGEQDCSSQPHLHSDPASALILFQASCKLPWKQRDWAAKTPTYWAQYINCKPWTMLGLLHCDKKDSKNSNSQEKTRQTEYK